MRQTALFVSLFASLPLAGCSGTPSRSAPAGPTGPVQLTVVDVSGAPFPGASVKIDGVVLQTDARGQVQSASVPARYDVTLATPDRKHAYVYEGLTGRAPTLRLEQLATAWKYVKIHVGVAPAGVLIVAAVAGSTARQATVAAHPDGTDLTLGWAGAEPSPTVLLTALHYTADPVTHAPTHYDGIASSSQPVADGASITWVPAFAPPTFGEHTVRVRVGDPGVTGVQLDMLVSAPADAAPFELRLPVLALDAGETAMLVPELPAARLDLAIVGVLTEERYATYIARDVGASRDPIDVTFSPTVSALLPEKDAKGFGPGDTLAWSAPPGEVVRVRLFDAGGTGAPDITPITTASEDTLPALDDVGITLPRGGVYAWMVEASSTVGTVDDVGANRYQGVRGADVAGTQQREFTLR